jgi:hypothetical protein
MKSFTNPNCKFNIETADDCEYIPIDKASLSKEALKACASSWLASSTPTTDCPRRTAELLVEYDALHSGDVPSPEKTDRLKRLLKQVRRYKLPTVNDRNELQLCEETLLAELICVVAFKNLSQAIWYGHQLLDLQPFAFGSVSSAFNEIHVAAHSRMLGDGLSEREQRALSAFRKRLSVWISVVLAISDAVTEIKLLAIVDYGVVARFEFFDVLRVAEFGLSKNITHEALLDGVKSKLRNSYNNAG